MLDKPALVDPAFATGILDEAVGNLDDCRTNPVVVDVEDSLGIDPF